MMPCYQLIKESPTEVFKEIAPLASRLAEIDKSFAEGKLSGPLIAEKAGIDQLKVKENEGRLELREFWRLRCPSTPGTSGAQSADWRSRAGYRRVSECRSKSEKL